MGRGKRSPPRPVFRKKVTLLQTVELEDREKLLQPLRELWCGGCGYGVVVLRDPPECPMCREANWRERPRVAHYN